MKRLGIFFFYEKNGYVDEFITYYLADLAKNLTELVVVCNGKLSEQGRKAFRSLPIRSWCVKTRALMCGPTRRHWTTMAGRVWRNLMKSS